MYRSEYARTPTPSVYFITSRFWRLVPTFYAANALTLVVYFLLYGTPSSQGDGHAHVLFSNVAILGYGLLSNNLRLLAPAWSLDTELQFYIAYPFLFFLLYKSKHALLAKFFLYFFSTLALIYFCRKLYSHPTIGVLPFYIFFFLLGDQANVSNWRPTKKLAITSLILTLTAIVTIIFFSESRPLLLGGRFYSEITEKYAIPAQVIFALALVPIALYSVQFRDSALSRHAGNLSYEFYLSHWIGVIIFNRLAAWHNEIYFRLLFFVLSIFFVLLVSFVIYIFIDKPIDKFRRRWLKNSIALN